MLNFVPLFMMILFFGIPIAAIVFFIVSLVKYCSARKENKIAPGSISAERLRTLLRRLVISCVIAVVLASAVVTCMVLFWLALAAM